MGTDADNKLTPLQHLVELRAGLIRCFFALIAGTIICLYFSKEVFLFLQKPLLAVMPPDAKFIAISPLEAFLTYFKVGFLGGAFLSTPIIFYQLWRFVAPGLMRHEKNITFVFVSLATLFFVGGALFGYFVIFPIGFRFIVSVLSGTDILFFPQMRDYLGFIARMLLIFGVVFEMPLVLVLLSRIGIVQHKTLAHARRYVIVIMVLAAGILTPGPDVVSQLLLAVPLLILYEISLIAVRILERRHRQQAGVLSENL